MSEDDEDRKRKEDWALGEYVVEPCPKCGRERLCICDSGKHRCEKCNWCPELNEYVGDEGPYHE